MWAWDLKAGAKVVRRIQAIHHNLAQVLCRIEVGESLISGVTPDHPFFRADTREFVALRDLPADARLLRLVDGETREARLSTLKITEHPKPCVPVFNLAVEGPEHNYFAENVLVHNKAPIEYFDNNSYYSTDWHALPDADSTGTDFDTISPLDAMPAIDTTETSE